MDALDKLGLRKSEQEIHTVLRNFELKWHDKALRAMGDERISRR